MEILSSLWWWRHCLFRLVGLCVAVLNCCAVIWEPCGLFISCTQHGRLLSFFLSSPLVVYIRRLKIQRRTRAAVQQFVVVALASSSLTYLGVLFFNIFLKLVGRTGGGSRLFVFLFGVALSLFCFSPFFLSVFSFPFYDYYYFSAAVICHGTLLLLLNLKRPSPFVLFSFFSSAASLFCDDGLLSNVQHDAQKSSSSCCCCCCWTISQFRRWIAFFPPFWLMAACPSGHIHNTHANWIKGEGKTFPVKSLCDVLHLITATRVSFILSFIGFLRWRRVK